MIPILETERLVLRAHRYDDFADCVAMWADPAVTRYIGGTPSTTQQTWFRLLRYPGLWALLGYGYWAIEEKSSGRFAGEVGFADFKRDITPSIDGYPEAGWALAPFAHGKGYATESLRASLGWADEHLSASQTVCIIALENLPSIRVAEKCGFKEFARTDSFGDTTPLYARARGTNRAHWTIEPEASGC